MSLDPYRRRYQSVVARDESKPVGSLNSTGYGATNLGRHITALVREELALMVVMTDSGEVYAFIPGGLRAEATEAQHPNWIVGTYTARCGVGTIAGDLRVQAKGLGRKAA